MKCLETPATHLANGSVPQEEMKKKHEREKNIGSGSLTQDPPLRNSVLTTSNTNSDQIQYLSDQPEETDKEVGRMTPQTKAATRTRMAAKKRKI